MNLQAKEEQIYEDLSMILQLVRKKLTLLISNPSQLIFDNKIEGYEQQHINHLLTAFVGKYSKQPGFSKTNQKVIERFFCRVKELTSQFLLKMPRNKLHLLPLIKVVEQFTAKNISQYNNAVLTSLLELVLQIRGIQANKGKIDLKNESLKEKFPLLKPADRIEQPMRLEERSKKQMNQVEQMQKNAELYSLIDIDSQHFRGNYFDTKNDQGTYVQNQMLFRNRFIKQIITSFEVQYQRYKKRQFSGAGTKMFCRFKKRFDEMDHYESLNTSRERKTTLQSPGFTRTQNYQKKGYAYSQHQQKREGPASSHTFDRDNKMALETFRSLFQEKMNEKKENIKLKNVILNLNESQTKIKVQFLNTKRRQFFRKSQDQTKFRYKYYNYKSNNTSKSSIKYRTINPQSTFNTIDH